MKCPACGFNNEDVLILELPSSRGKSVNWAKCKDCKSYFIAEEYSFEAEIQHGRATSYGKAGSGKLLNEYKKRMFCEVLSELKKEKRYSGSLFDIGCSYGGFLFVAKKDGYDVSGMDILEDAIAYVNDKGVKAYVSSSLKELNLNKCFDVVTVLDCNYYWSNQSDELTHVNHILNEDGLLIMRVVDKSWMVNIGRFVRRGLPSFGNKIIRRALNDHRFSMPVKSLKKVLQKKGFAVKRISILGAQHSNDSSFPVKMSFFMGSILYRLTGLFVAPGAILISKKLGRKF